MVGLAMPIDTFLSVSFERQIVVHLLDVNSICFGYLTKYKDFSITQVVHRLMHKAL